MAAPKPASRMPRALLPFVLLAALLMGAGPVEARRVALVIGNGAYRHLPALANPARDARAIDARLTALGFTVDLVLDADLQGLQGAVERLGRAAEAAEAAVLYYAGHAVEIGGQNRILPVGVKPDAVDLERGTLRYDEIEQRIGARAATTLVFLDSCRDNPLAGQPVAAAPASATASPRPARGRPAQATPASPATRAVGTGLAGGTASPPGMLLAFATAPGRVAMDGDGENSPFTTALLAHIGTPDLEVRQMLGRVRRAVREATGGLQVPWDNSSLEGEFFFASTVPIVAPKRPAPPAPQRQAVSTAAEEERGIDGTEFFERVRGNSFLIEVKETRFGRVGEIMQVHVRADGRLFGVFGLPNERRPDIGEAWIENGQFCSQWQRLRRGASACWKILRDGESWSALVGDRARIEFSIRAGDPYRLAR